MLGKRLLAASMVIVLSGLVGIVETRATSLGNDVIYACYDPGAQILRVINDPAAGCKPNQTLLAWNQTGPQGPAGPQGPQGAPGPAGPSHAYIVKHRIGGTLTSTGAGASATFATLSLPAGSYILDGKAEFTGVDGIANAGCWFSPPGLGPSDQSDVIITVGNNATVSIHDAQTFSTATTLSLLCGDGPGAAATILLERIVLRATLVGAIN